MFPPEGVPSLDMLLDSGSCEPNDADDSEGGDGDNDDEEHGYAHLRVLLHDDKTVQCVTLIEAPAGVWPQETARSI